MLSLIYAYGLRPSELLNLKPSDVASDKHLLIIRNAKGRKDRVVPISDKIIEMLWDYYNMYRPKIWLFEGRNEGEQYSEQSLQSVLKQALSKSKIRKSVTLIWLRHSYVTHLLQGLIYVTYNPCLGTSRAKPPRSTPMYPQRVFKKSDPLSMICDRIITWQENDRRPTYTAILGL